MVWRVTLLNKVDMNEDWDVKCFTYTEYSFHDKHSMACATKALAQS
jgi:hypothetical protein